MNVMLTLILTVVESRVPGVPLASRLILSLITVRLGMQTINATDSMQVFSGVEVDAHPCMHHYVNFH